MADRLSALADKLAGMGGWSRWFAGFGCGVGFALAQPPLGLWPLIFVAGPVLFHLWRGASGGAAFRLGLGFGAGYFGVGLHWIVEPFLVEPETYGWMAPPALLAIALGLGLFPAAAFWAAARGARRGLAPYATLVLGWGLSELARSYILTGFPWALPAYVWVDTPMAQIAALTGPYGLSLLTLAAALAPGLVPGADRRRAAALTVGVGLVVAAWGWGAARMGPADIAGQPVIRIVQPNIAQATKWDVDLIRAHFDKTLALTARPPAEAAPAVILWPESAVTFPLDMADTARAEIAAAARGAEVALGSLRIDGGPEQAQRPPVRWRNSLFLLGVDGALSRPFDKIHLVPFGEYLPLEDLLTRLDIAALAQRGAGIVPGTAPVIMRPTGAAPFAPLICYEMIFPREVAAAAAGADWLALATNDAWFGGWAGPIQHLAQAQMRAIETGRPIARAANTGISAMIDPYGRLTARLPIGAEGILDAPLPRKTETIYTEFGEVITALFIAILTFCAALGLFRVQSNVMRRHSL